MQTIVRAIIAPFERAY